MEERRNKAVKKVQDENQRSIRNVYMSVVYKKPPRHRGPKGARHKPAKRTQGYMGEKEKDEKGSENILRRVNIYLCQLQRVLGLAVNKLRMRAFEGFGVLFFFLGI